MKKDVKEMQSGYPLRKHDAKSFGVAFALGVVIGLAIIIPGVSGAAVAIMFGMYATLLYAIGNILNDFKRCLAYLIPIGLGAVVGFLGGFIVIQKLFGRYMFAIVCLFAGLMCGAVPAITGEVKGEKRTPLRMLLLVLGVLVPLAVGGVSILLDAGAVSVGGDTFVSFPPYLFALYLPLGMVVATTQIVPGLSATAILMACGQFKPILNSLHLDYILENPAVLGLYVCIGVGFLGGMVLISRLFSKLIEKRRAPTFFFVVGLSLGSIASMFFNADMWEIYTGWTESGAQTPSIVIGAILLALGFVCSFLLTRYELKKRS
jgi:putative membrane protein